MLQGCKRICQDDLVQNLAQRLESLESRRQAGHAKTGYWRIPRQKRLVFVLPLPQKACTGKCYKSVQDPSQEATHLGHKRFAFKICCLCTSDSCMCFSTWSQPRLTILNSRSGRRAALGPNDAAHCPLDTHSTAVHICFSMVNLFS